LTSHVVPHFLLTKTNTFLQRSKVRNKKLDWWLNFKIEKWSFEFKKWKNWGRQTWDTFPWRKISNFSTFFSTHYLIFSVLLQHRSIFLLQNYFIFCLKSLFCRKHFKVEFVVLTLPWQTKTFRATNGTETFLGSWNWKTKFGEKNFYRKFQTFFLFY
jgi:hypothetical protein